MMGRLMQTAFSRIVASAVCASLLAACGGGGGSSSAVPVTGSQSHTSRVAIALSFPSKGTAAKLGGRHANYIPSGTRGVGIDYAPSPSGYTNATTDTKPMAGSPLVAGTAPCGTTQPDGSYSCIIYLPAVPVGYNDFKVTLWNAQPAGCDANDQHCDFTGATALSTTVNSFLAVKEGQSNNFSLGFAAQVDSVYVALSGGIVDGTLSSVTATLTLKDTNGFTIVDAPSLYDKNGNPLTVSLNIPVTGGGSLSFPGPSSTVAFTSVGNSSNTVNVNYDGTYQFASSGASQPSVTATLNGGAAINGSIVNSPLPVTQSNNSVGVPSAPQIARLNAGPLTGTPSGYLTVGSDSNLWLAEGSEIASITTGGVVSEYVTPANGAGAHDASGIGSAADGDLYWMDRSANAANAAVGRFRPGAGVAGNSFSAAPSTFSCCGHSGFTFVSAADGYVYWGENYDDGIEYFAPNSFSGSASYIGGSLGFGGYAFNDVVAGPPVSASLHPSVCGVQRDNVGVTAAVECIDTTTHSIVTSQPTSHGTGTGDGVLALGSDGALYVGENGFLEQFTLTNGSLNAGTPIALASGGAVTGIARGSDGNVWFTESNGYVGKIDASSSAPAVSEYAPAATGSAASNPYGLTAGPAASNKLYFYDTSNHNVYSITP